MTTEQFIDDLKIRTSLEITHKMQDGFVHLTVVSRNAKMRFNIRPETIETANDADCALWAIDILNEMRLEAARKPCVNCNE